LLDGIPDTLAGQIAARVIDAGSRWRCEIPARQRSISTITRGTICGEGRASLVLHMSVDRRWRNAKERKQSHPCWKRWQGS
jgi:hypothetical protein